MSFQKIVFVVAVYFRLSGIYENFLTDNSKPIA